MPKPSETKQKNGQRNVQQHFVTAAYLAGFTPDGSRDSKLLNADRFVYSPFESEEVPALFKGASQNIRVSISPTEW